MENLEDELPKVRKKDLRERNAWRGLTQQERMNRGVAKRDSGYG
jgi:hypothetical protein